MNDTITGHSRHLRAVLREARERAGISQAELARRISARLDEGDPETATSTKASISSSSISAWERFDRHPPVDIMALWARTLGLRLRVDLDEATSTRVIVLMKPESAEIGRLLDLLTEGDREMVRDLVNRLSRRSI